jgi:glycine/D-amino acid oxidase-like deaminating enzyme
VNSLQDKAMEPDYCVIGGGLVGASIAFGLVHSGKRVVMLDEGDIAFRASRANFSLIWVQSKGLALPPYAVWTQTSARLWGELSDLLQRETGIDVGHSQNGGFTLCLSDAEVVKRTSKLEKFFARPDAVPFDYEVLDHVETRRRLPDIGDAVVGSIYCPLDGHANALKLLRALHTCFVRNGGDYRPARPVNEIVPLTGGGFSVRGAWGEVQSPKIVLASGLGNKALGAFVDLNCPVRPSKGQIIVTEKTEPFLHNPMVTVRQTDEGGVMLGDSQEEKGFDTQIVDTGILSIMAERAIKMFPRLESLNVVRTWSALRVMSPDTFPIYDESRTAPGAFSASCHSGVTLAASHALELAPALATDARLPGLLSAFSAERFDVPKN